jgi:hypothetical protein
MMSDERRAFADWYRQEIGRKLESADGYGWRAFQAGVAWRASNDKARLGTIFLELARALEDAQPTSTLIAEANEIIDRIQDPLQQVSN